MTRFFEYYLTQNRKRYYINQDNVVLKNFYREYEYPDY